MLIEEYCRSLDPENRVRPKSFAADRSLTRHHSILRVFCKLATTMTKHRSPDERAVQILTAARRCFLENGYFATKMDAIARESGLSKGGVYFHFDSKRDIFRALVQEEYDTSMGFIDDVLATDTPIAAKLSELADHFVNLFANSDRPRFMVIIGEMALRDAEIQELLQELQLAFFTRLADLLEKSIQAGQLKEADSYATAIVLKSMLDGIQANFALEIEMDLEAVLGAAMNLFANGLLEL